MTLETKNILFQSIEVFEKIAKWAYHVRNTPATPLNDAHFGRVFYFYTSSQLLSVQ